MIVVLAGRRIDPIPSDYRRFPLEHVPVVRQHLKDVFLQLQPDMLICSGACGADLLAMDVASELQICRYMILPFRQARFRETSVIDRPGNWGQVFDRVIQEIKQNSCNKLKVLGTMHNPDQDYMRVNMQIFKEAERIHQQSENSDEPIHVILVWDGISRGENDFTWQFADTAHQNNLFIHEILTTW